MVGPVTSSSEYLCSVVGTATWHEMCRRARAALVLVRGWKVLDRNLTMCGVVTCAAPVANVKMTEPSKVLHIRNVGPEISEVRAYPPFCVHIGNLAGAGFGYR